MFLHGYPTSSLDYTHIFNFIPKEFGIVAHDHLGFGMSQKPINNNYLISDQAKLALDIYRTIGINKCNIVAHDYGTSVATEILALAGEDKIQNLIIESVTLCKGSMLIDMAKLRPIQKLLKHNIFGPIVSKLANSNTFHRNMKNIWHNKDLYDRSSMEKHWTNLVAGNGRKVLPKITQYIDQRYKYYDKWIGAIAETSIPLHIVWAANDPIAIVQMAYKLKEINPSASLSIIPNCGHYPMIEKGREWISIVVGNINLLHK